MFAITRHQGNVTLNQDARNDNSRLRASELNTSLGQVKNCYTPLVKLPPGHASAQRLFSHEEVDDVVIDMNTLRANSVPPASPCHITELPDKPASVNNTPSGKKKATVHFISIDMEGTEDIFSGPKKEKQSCFLQYLENTGLALARNLITVGIPTALREYVNRGLLKKVFEGNPMLARTLGGVTIGFPIALQLIAIARDINAGTQSPASLRARLANITLTGLSGAAVAATGGLTLAASSLIAAVFVYVPLRDLLQYFLRLGDNNSGEIHLCATGKTAALYVVNQVAVDHAMTMLSEALTPLVGNSVAANMLGRALINIAGETGDELAYRGFNAQAENNPHLQYHLGFRRKDEITRQTAMDHIFNTLASRASLFSTSFANGFAVPVEGILNSMVIGATLGAGYMPFIYTHAQRSTIRP